MRHCNNCKSDNLKIDDHIIWCLECGEPHARPGFTTQSEHILYESKKQDCNDKTYFEGVWDVRWWIHQNGKPGFSYYHCDICGGYHLTSRYIEEIDE